MSVFHSLTKVRNIVFLIGSLVVTSKKDALLIDPRSNTKPGGDEPRIGITGVLDTEEEIWSPKYGLKGKIDVTVQAHVAEKSSSIKNHCFDPKDSSSLQIFPLEIKTGRQPSGIEHIAQTMLYTLLLSDRYSKLTFLFIRR
jgi:DNA replication ATP-dependent helicase Dna2